MLHRGNRASGARRGARGEGTFAWMETAACAGVRFHSRRFAGRLRIPWLDEATRYAAVVRNLAGFEIFGHRPGPSRRSATLAPLADIASRELALFRSNSDFPTHLRFFFPFFLGLTETRGEIEQPVCLIAWTVVVMLGWQRY